MHALIPSTACPFGDTVLLPFPPVMCFSMPFALTTPWLCMSFFYCIPASADQPL